MIRLERQQNSNPLSVLVVTLSAIALSLIVSLLVLNIAGHNAWPILVKAFSETYFTGQGILSLLVYVTPISLCALAVVVSAKAGLWNVGIEGQLLLGAVAANGIGIYYGHLPPYVLIPLTFVASMLAGALYCWIAALPRVFYGVSEILSTILLNSVAGFLVGYLANRAWRDYTSTSPQTREISPNARISQIPGLGRLHWGFFVSIAVVILVWFLLKRSVLGFKIRAVGESLLGSQYAGINAKKFYLIAMLASGAIAGLAGMFEVTGVSYRMRPDLAADFGISGFVIAWISRLNPLIILIVSYFFAGLTVVGFKLQMAGLQSSIVNIIKGLILFFILAGETFTYLKIKRSNKEE